MTNDIEARLRMGPRPGNMQVDIVELAEREGLIDVAIAQMDSPIGELLLARTPAGLVRLSFFGHDETLEELSARISPRILEAPKQLDPIRRQLDEYFEGARQT